MKAEEKQALIDDCQREISGLKRDIDRCDAIGTCNYLYHLQSKLKRQQIALSALTAPDPEPVYQVSYRGNWSDVSRDLYEEQLQVNRNCARTLHTAPPAPVMQAVGVVRESEQGFAAHFSTDVKDGEQLFRAAGYPVEGE